MFGYTLLFKLGKKHNPEISSEVYPQIFITCYISGYFGARLLSIIIEEAPQSEIAVGLGFYVTRLFTWGPMTFYGGALLAGLFGMIYIKVKNLPMAHLLDLALPSGFLALCFGRIGCFLNGDDYGIPVQFSPGTEPPFWSVRFTNLGDQIYRWPVQLIESGAVFLVIIGLIIFFKPLQKTFRPGIIAYLMTLGYSNIRLFDEFLRDDFRGSILAPWLSTSQFISLILLTVCLLFSPYFFKSAAYETKPI